MLLLLTDVDAVYTDFGRPSAKSIARISVSAVEDEAFAAWSIGPKIEAAVKFVTISGKLAAIGRLEDALAIVAGEAVTTIDAGNGGVRYRV
ncbi:hypothetical protein [Agrobacterium rubi]|uniref:Aspartate/glutamate/uridylate kinase domain-containing protein n=1 Tax=Agrobacterium rubi TaxID=28099 RepID=A0AAE7R116_9HYPH|nr:hypothetical protein [Agrobacterium rubi]NTE86593.1 hypothetical protein [Agrobacterium rubi]NTF02525.1 hypothetical protein [Agrobacterium rubi]NTF36770.1 hypothetical protein [Agrobacterium rubi]OCJ55612.1 hypothetical protein A6U92_03235 [Agrobacterium rubi]QTF99218.1 hypothetical protein G6M88_01840 [Agrobacterium rubi]